jgi:tRNA-2-methylthio-N6-dimethylallyladenosine synthase
VAEIDGIARIRYTTSHPRDVDDDLIAAHAEVPALMPFLHLPVQAGSDRILRAMNRGHDADAYRRVVDRLRTARPDLALSSDFIVGFPGETAAEFQATLDLVDEIGFVQAYSFKYSVRPGTPAATMPGQVPEAEKATRLAALQDRLNAQQIAFNQRCEGLEMNVLFDRAGKHPGQVVGRSPFMQPVHAQAPATLLGRVRRVVIERGRPNSLSGRLIDNDAAAPKPAPVPDRVAAGGGA